MLVSDPATPERCTLSLHDALPISRDHVPASDRSKSVFPRCASSPVPPARAKTSALFLLFAVPLDPPGMSTTCLASRSEEHTSELQSQFHLVCRLLLEKKNT